MNSDSEPEVDTKHYTVPTVPKRRLSRKRPNGLGHIGEDTFTVWSTRATLLGIHVDQLRRLVLVKAPPVLFHIYRRLKHDKLDIPADLEFVETFCGAQALCHGFRAFQWRAIGLDLQQHEIFQNAMSPKGFVNHLGHTQRSHLLASSIMEWCAARLCGSAVPQRAAIRKCRLDLSQPEIRTMTSWRIGPQC